MDDQATKPNRTPEALGKIDVFILCGGKGTRLQSVLPHTPKPLAPFHEKTFLDILIESLTSARFRKIILGVGYLSDHIKNKYQDLPAITISEEHTPLGTGGAVKNAERLLASDDVLVVNGDSIFNGLDYGSFYEFHKQHEGAVSIALASPREDKDFGGVVLAADHQIIAFNEKNNLEAHRFMNGGVYFMKKEALEMMPEGSFSLEHDFFPKLANHSLYGFVHPGEVLDIGTPERYERAKKILS